MAAFHLMVLLSLFSVAFSDEKSTEKSLDRARGWGDHIQWTTLNDIFEDALADKQKKPVMVIIHKTWCKACKNLKPKFAGSKEIAKLSKHFSMVNCEDDEEPNEAKYSLDGRYIPRIYFLDPILNVLDQVYNTNPKFNRTKYYYSNPSEIIASMQSVITRVTSKDKYGSERGLGRMISWVSFEDGMQQVKQSGRNMFLFIHKTWCGACKNLKPKIANSVELADLATRFIMVNVEDDEEPMGKEYEVDGRYYPRLYFIDENGKVMPQFWNEGSAHKQYKYYYGSAEEIVSSMHRVLTNGNDVNEKLENVEEDGQKVIKPKQDRGDADDTKAPEKKVWGKDINWETLNGGSEKIEELKTTVEDTKGNGWGENVVWLDFDEAITKGKENNIPVMAIIHKSWCGACKNLKKKLSASEQFENMARHFMMVNIKDDDSDTDTMFDVDGAYAPRIFFLDPFTGSIMKELHNTNSDFKQYKYAYGNVDDLVETMKRAGNVDFTANAPDRGFGTSITWSRLEIGLKQAKESLKPVMVIIHKSWCQFSQELKKTVSNSEQIIELSKSLIMVNLEDSEDPKDGRYAVDGDYVPRIVFLDSTGKLNKDIVNEPAENDQAKHFFLKEENVISAMKRAIAAMAPAEVDDRGFGKHIKWYAWDSGLQEAKKKEEPMFVIIHKSWCGACKALKPVFAKSKKIAEMSKKFVMVNLEDDEEPKDSQFEVDGKYYPRIFFLDSNGKVRKDIHNTDPKYIKYKFSYGNTESLEKNFKRATELLVQSLDRGFGKNIRWITFPEGLAEMKVTDKPMMLIFHRTECTSCKSLKPRLADSKRVAELSTKFTMVNVMNEEEPSNDVNFDIDGKYIPRILFLSTDGKVMKDVFNFDTIYKENKYYYYDEPSVVKSMETVLDKQIAKTEQEKKEEL